MIAGLTWRDMMPLRPGLVMDLFFIRRAYDDEQHQLRREVDDHDISADDFDLLEEGDALAGS